MKRNVQSSIWFIPFLLLSACAIEVAPNENAANTSEQLNPNGPQPLPQKPTFKPSTRSTVPGDKGEGDELQNGGEENADPTQRANPGQASDPIPSPWFFSPDNANAAKK